eukprot:6174534-Pleurochrysis_carterae.AAC.1
MAKPPLAWRWRLYRVCNNGSYAAVVAIAVVLRPWRRRLSCREGDGNSLAAMPIAMMSSQLQPSLLAQLLLCLREAARLRERRLHLLRTAHGVHGAPKLGF